MPDRIPKGGNKPSGRPKAGAKSSKRNVPATKNPIPGRRRNKKPRY